MALITELPGGINTTEDQIVANVRSSIRRPLPQVRPFQPQGTPLVILAGGPSLSATREELRACLWRGCRVAAVNGAYQWAINHMIKPDIAIAIDARPENAAFFANDVPGCQYLIASQCAPAMFDALEGRNVWIWHALSYHEPEEAELELWYGKGHTWPVTGGSTVTLRAISLLRMLGFLRMDIFGFDSCWMDGQHHAYPQSLNDTDKRITVTAKVPGADDEGRVFECAPWHMKQVTDFEMLVKERGQMFDLHVHGDGLIAYMMRTGAQVQRGRSESCAVA